MQELRKGPSEEQNLLKAKFDRIKESLSNYEANPQELDYGFSMFAEIFFNRATENRIDLSSNDVAHVARIHLLETWKRIAQKNPELTAICALLDTYKTIDIEPFLKGHASRLQRAEMTTGNDRGRMLLEFRDQLLKSGADNNGIALYLNHLCRVTPPEGGIFQKIKGFFTKK